MSAPGVPHTSPEAEFMKRLATRPGSQYFTETSGQGLFIRDHGDLINVDALQKDHRVHREDNPGGTIQVTVPRDRALRIVAPKSSWQALRELLLDHSTLSYA